MTIEQSLDLALRFTGFLDGHGDDSRAKITARRWARRSG
jgi:hypothetical protein